MTDYEIVHEYLWPQMRRMEDQERARKNLPPEPREDDPPYTPPSRRIMIAMLRGLGMSKEQAVAEYERQKKMDDELQAKLKQQKR